MKEGGRPQRRSLFGGVSLFVLLLSQLFFYVLNTHTEEQFALIHFKMEEVRFDFFTHIYIYTVWFFFFHHRVRWWRKEGDRREEVFLAGFRFLFYLYISPYYFLFSTYTEQFALLYISKWRIEEVRFDFFTQYIQQCDFFFHHRDDEGRMETAAKKSFWRGFVIISRHVVLSTSSYQHTHHNNNRTYLPLSTSIDRASVSSRISVFFFSLSLSR